MVCLSINYTYMEIFGDAIADLGVSRIITLLESRGILKIGSLALVLLVDSLISVSSALT